MAEISVCIATFRRQDRLRALLHDLTRQQQLPREVVVVDNDATGSARAVIEEVRATQPGYALVYDIQPERNIAKTRNLTAHLASSQWLAFVDDDERAPPQWLQLLLACATGHGADGVLGPVEPQVPESAPAWIRRGKFYDWAHQATGEVVARSGLRFGNVLLRGELLKSLPGPFDPEYGLRGGEDIDVLVRFGKAGGRTIWCDEAFVTEPVESSRLSLAWLLERAFSGGQFFGHLRLDGSIGKVNLPMKFALALAWLAQMCVSFLLAACTVVLGRHRAAGWLIKAWANMGKLTALTGARFSHYA